MKKYPTQTIRKLLETNAVTSPTREALIERLHAVDDYKPIFFDPAQFKLLNEICRRLIIQEPNEEFVDCAAYIDQSLSRNESDGWRYDEMPPDVKAFQHGLAAVNETVQIEFKTDFITLTDAQKDDVLTKIQKAEARGAGWKTLSAKLFFEEVLAKTVAAYYAHPLGQEQIGYAGLADAPGWTQIGLNEREEREPRALS